MLPASFTWYFQLANVLGTMVLAVPVFKLDMQRKVMNKIIKGKDGRTSAVNIHSDPSAGTDAADSSFGVLGILKLDVEAITSEDRRRARKAAAEAQRSIIDGWTPIERFCLVLGYLFVFVGNCGMLLTNPQTAVGVPAASYGIRSADHSR